MAEGGVGKEGRGAEERAGTDDAAFSSLPRVLIVSRRTLRKDKFVDFVGEYHLDLIVTHGAVPIIVPRVAGIAEHLDSFEPIHGVLLCEGEDIDPALYQSELAQLSADEAAQVHAAHSSDVAIDAARDSIELGLARRCLERSIPYLGICRGSQLLNVACGGSLYQDVETELTKHSGVATLKHIDYQNYDRHRHAIHVLPQTPLWDWFHGSLERNGQSTLYVNSYHHQGIRRLAGRLKPMAEAEDGLVEAYYDPDCYAPERGRFLVGLQFHPERMRVMQDAQKAAVTASAGASAGSPAEEFEYPECPVVYQAFVRAVVAFAAQLHQQGASQMESSSKTAARKGSLGSGASAAAPVPAPGARLLTVQRSFRAARKEYEARAALRLSQTWRSQANLGQAPPSTGEGGPGSPAVSRMLPTSSMPLRHSFSDPAKRRVQSGDELEAGASFLMGQSQPVADRALRLQQLGVTMHKGSNFALLSLSEAKENKAASGLSGPAPAREAAALEALSRDELQKLLAYHQGMILKVEAALRGKQRGRA